MNRHITDLIRIGVLLIATGVYLHYSDPTNDIIIEALVIGVFLVGGTHLTRRILMHRVDLQEFALKAKENPLGASIVFASVVLFLVAVMYIPLMVLK